jgi:guanine deaminase
MSSATALRAAALWFRGDPFELPPDQALGHDSDALLVMRDGRIEAFGPAAALLPGLDPAVTVRRFPGATLVPGFIDCHVHFAQLGIMGAGGLPLLDWLERCTFPEERRFADPVVARHVARLFLQELARHGTTTAAVFGTVHAEAIDVLFQEAMDSGLRVIAGKSLMDRNAPDGLRDTAQQGYEESLGLIRRWHGRGRLGYAITPRFLATSSPAQLEAVTALRRAFPTVWLQSHLSENLAEVAWIRRLHPASLDYVDAMERSGLLGPRAIHGHGIHLSPREWARLSATGTAIAHCPTSNLFLGSGLFDLAGARRQAPPVSVGLATDVGAGTTLSMLRTMGAACEVAQLLGHALAPAQALWLATGGAARALDIADSVGNLRPGLDADIVVLDPSATPLLAWVAGRAADPGHWLGVMQTLGDDRCVAAVYAAGRRVGGTVPGA